MAPPMLRASSGGTSRRDPLASQASHFSGTSQRDPLALSQPDPLASSQRDPLASQASQFSGFDTASQFGGFGTVEKAEDLLSPMQKQVAAWSQDSEGSQSQSYRKIQGTILSPAAAASAIRAMTTTTCSGENSTGRSGPTPPATAAPLPAHSAPSQGSRFVVPPNIAGSLTPEQRTRWSRNWALAKRKKISSASKLAPPAPPSTAPTMGALAGPGGMASLSSTLPRPRPRLMPVPKILQVMEFEKGSVVWK